MRSPGPRTRRAPWVGVEPPLAQVIAAGVVALLAAALVEIVLRGTIGLLTGAVLVLVATGTALTVRARDLFTAGVLPPLQLVGLLMTVALLHPTGVRIAGLDPSSGIAQRVIAGFVDLAGPLVLAHTLALLVVALRVRVARVGRRRAAQRTQLTRDRTV